MDLHVNETGLGQIRKDVMEGRIKRSIEEPDYHFIIQYEGAKPTGFIEIDARAKPPENPMTFVAKDSRRAGRGKELLKSAMELLNLKDIRLVAASEESLGFVKEARKVVEEQKDAGR